MSYTDWNTVVNVTTALTWVNVEKELPGEALGQVICLTANGKLIVMAAKTVRTKGDKYAIEWWAVPLLPN